MALVRCNEVTSLRTRQHGRHRGGSPYRRSFSDHERRWSPQGLPRNSQQQDPARRTFAANTPCESVITSSTTASVAVRERARQQGWTAEEYTTASGSPSPHVMTPTSSFGSNHLTTPLGTPSPLQITRCQPRTTAQSLAVRACGAVPPCERTTGNHEVGRARRTPQPLPTQASARQRDHCNSHPAPPRTSMIKHSLRAHQPSREVVLHGRRVGRATTA